MNKKILLSVALVFILMLTGLISANAYATTVTVQDPETNKDFTVTAGLSKASSNKWNAEIVLSNKNPKLETTSVKKLITSYFPGLESQFGNKIKIDNGVGTGSVVKVNTQDITILLYGDVDKDAEVTEHDAYKIVKTGTGLENLTDAICEKAGDVDGDGELTENDAFIIVKYSVGNAEFNKVTVHTLVTSNFVVMQLIMLLQ